MQDKVKIGQIWRHKTTHYPVKITDIKTNSDELTMSASNEGPFLSFIYYKNSLFKYYYLDMHPNKIWKELCQNETFT